MSMISSSTSPSSSTSSSSSSSSSTPLDTSRVTGLASGMNVDAIVKNMIKADSVPLNQMKQQQQLLEWQRDDYRAMNTQLSDLKTSAFNLSLQSSFISRQVSSSDSSAVTATAGADVPIGQYKVSVSQIATAATNTSVNGISADPNNKIDPNAALDTQKFKNGNDFSNFTIVTYDATGKPQSQTFTIDPTKDTLNTVLGKITNSNLGVRAFYDSGTDKVVLQRTVTGNMNTATDTAHFLGAEIGYNGSTASFLANTLDVKAGTQNPTTGAWSSRETGGTDAKFTYDDTLNVTSHNNTYNVGGLNLNLNNVTPLDSSDPTGKKHLDVNLNVTNNTDAAFKNITDFVKKYNDTIQKINDKISEKRDLKYPPLTDDQKKSMSANDITLWTNKAKSGMLSNDSILPNGLSEMRKDWYSPVTSVSNSKYQQLADIGITTSSNYKDNGKLIIDDTKLKAALADDPNAVMQLFTGSGSTFATEGIAKRLNDTIDNTVKNIESKAGNTSMNYSQYFLGTSINDLQTRIDDFNKHLNDLQNRYYKQFTAMEQAINTSNQQAAYLQSNLGSSSSGG